MSLKVLGYSLEEISVMLKMPSLNVSLKETLEQQRKAFEEKENKLKFRLRRLNEQWYVLRKMKSWIVTY